LKTFQGGTTQKVVNFEWEHLVFDFHFWF
jgi:hypothetical protein